ncbi:hypothetical protein BJY04DRAFT_189926 [Aspergillus karnatakaensis]|uniref:uncharacterized protein n=1 Tax=Aspergillus karnatakaensis TaxID=1810916 RepID=UPI003CCD1D82
MMASILVEHLRSRRQNGSLDGHPGVAFAYCTHREQGQQSLDTVLSSLLAQLALDLPIIYSTLQELYSSNFGKARLSSKDILSELHSAVSSYSNVSIVIDALDECERDATRKALLSALHLLQKASDVRIMVTARTDMALNFLNHAQKMEICANTRDIHRYLRGRVSELPMVVQDSPKLQEKIATLTSFSIIKTIPAYSFEPSATSFAS